MIERLNSNATRVACGLLLACCLLWPEILPGQDKQPEAPKNPLGRLFQNLDRQIRGEETEPTDADDESERAGRDKFDVRTPQNPENSRRLAQAQRLIKDQRWQDAVEILQYLLDRPSDSLVLRSDGEWESLRVAVERLLHVLPEAGRRSYESRFGTPADQLLEQAIAEQREDLLVEVRRRFRYLPAGQRAGGLLVSRWGGRGNFAALAELAEELNADSSEGHWLIVAAVAQYQMGHPDAGVALLGRTLGWQEKLGVDRGLSPEGWLQSLPRLPSPGESGLPESSMGQPFLLADWSQPRLTRHSVEDQYQLLMRDMEDQQRAAVPTSHPVFADNLVIYRDLSGLRARDCQTGAIVWQQLAEQDFEASLVPSRDDDWDLENIDMAQMTYNSAQVDQHPLSTMLFRDGVSSAMTVSDGRLFTVERQDPQAPLNRNQYRRGPGFDQADWAVNELVCRDVQSGQRLWSLGGPEIEPLFTRPLAGTYFFGPPVPHEGELLVIAERDAEMFLFGLEPQSGSVLWSQTIGSSGRPLSEDPVRRMWLCQPVVAHGLILCPTTCGWFVAVNEYSHQLEWAYRYAAKDEDSRRRFRAGFAMHSVQPLNQRWYPGRPILSGNRIILTPSELPDEFNSMQPTLVCLDTHGKLQWQVPKEAGLFVAGVFSGRVVVVGKTSIKAYNLESQVLDWELRLPDSAGMPTGTGTLLGQNYVLPLGERLLFRFDVTTGKAIEPLVMADSQPTLLGNLAVYGGQLFSLAPTQISSFPSREAENLRWAEWDNDSPKRILREVQMQISAGESKRALEVLERVDRVQRDDWPQEQRQLAQQLEWDLLTLLYSQPAETTSEQLTRLEQLAQSPERASVLLRLRAEHAIRNGDVDSATGILLRLLRQPEPGMITEGTRESRLDMWVGRRLEQLSRVANPQQQELLTNRLLELVSAVNSTDGALRYRLALALSFHPVGNDLLLQLARAERDQDQLTRASIQYRRLLRAGTPQQKLVALREMAEMFVERGHFREALGCWKELQDREDLPELVDGQPRAMFAAASIDRTQAQLGQAPRDWEAIWRSRPLQVERIAGRRNRGMQMVLENANDLLGTHTVLSQRRLLFDTQANRLYVEDFLSGGAWWSIPLRAVPELRHQATVGYDVAGMAMYALHRGGIHALGIVDHEMLWTFLPDPREEASRRLRAPGRPRQITLANAASFLSTYGVRAAGQNGYLLGASDDVVLLQLRRLTALDALTGEILWTDSDYLNASAAIFRQGELITTARGGERNLRRVLDGSLLTSENTLLQSMQAAYQMRGDQLVDLEAIPDSSPRSWRFRARRVKSGQTIWSHEFEDSAQFARLDHDHVAVLSADGALQMLSIEGGELRNLGEIPKPLLAAKRRVSLLADEQRVFVVVEHGAAHAIYVNMPSIRANGTILAFARSGGMLWQQETSKIGQSDADSTAAASKPEKEEEGKKPVPPMSLTLVVPDFNVTPVLVLLGDRPEQRDNLNFRHLRLVCLDKQTGKPLLDWERPSDQGGFIRMQFDYLNGWLDLDTYNYRLRVSMVSESR
ncbi:MAG: hypothetical protein KDA90_19460 [Planctomycetaceae bacterium]|nr:hypothetical protein [Planctomycetaceae bacterium]